MDRQVTFHCQFAITDDADALGYGGECRKFLYIQEVSTSRMSVALGVASFDGDGIDRSFNMLFVEIRFIQS